MTDQHEPCTDPACHEHGIAASNARQSEFYANNDRTIVAGPDDDEPEFKVPPYEGEDYTTAAICEGIYALWTESGTHGSLDGDDPLADNIKRAKKASDAVEVYAEASGIYEGEHFLTALGDLLSDLRHLLDYVGLTDDSEGADGHVTDLEALAGRDLHYDAEIRGEL